LLPPDTFLGHKKCVCGRSSALGELTAPPDPLAGNGGGPPRKGKKGEEGRGRGGGKGRGRAIPLNENPGYGLGP